MEVSVAMATCNGAAYLGEQLASIATQRRPPDELVICDDASRDDTAEIVRRFAASVPFSVRFEVNARVRGVAGNFSKAVAACRGDWIVLADQDDVWMPQKIESLLAAALQVRNCGFVFSDAVLVDECRRALGCRLWQSVGFSRSQQQKVNCGRALDVLLKRNVATGATMMLRAEHRDVMLPVDAHWVHDGWFALLLAAVSQGVAVAEPLIEYRQHARQQIGARPRSFFEQYRRARGRGPEWFEGIAESYAAARERLARFPERLQVADALARLEAKVRHYRSRARIHNSAGWRVPLALRELACHRYGRYSSGWRSLAQDLLL